MNAAVALEYGWPTCCGHTMTIDSPDEQRISRAALAAIGVQDEFGRDIGKERDDSEERR